MSTTTVDSVKPPKGKPKWLRVKLPTGKKYTQLRNLVDTYNLHTICTSGSCPNMGECWGEGTATFMILGNVCTRSCGFCGVKTGRPDELDWAEPEKVARSIKIMGIRHAVITSVDRDDLKDMGSILWAETVKAIRRMNPETTLETLIPDFQGIERHLDRILEVAPEVISHNMETVRRLTREELDSIVAERIPLAEAARAHELLESGRYAGKVVLVTGAAGSIGCRGAVGRVDRREIREDVDLPASIRSADAEPYQAMQSTYLQYSLCR